MTTEIIPHPLRQYEGKSFVTLSEMRIEMDDPVWREVIGVNVEIPGGTELDVDDARLAKALDDIEECDQDWDDAMDRRPDLFLTVGSGIELMVPLVIDDVDLPPAKILVPIRRLQEGTQQVDSGAGANATERATPSICGHQAHEIGTIKGCRACIRRHWTIKARRLGVISE